MNSTENTKVLSRSASNSASVPERRLTRSQRLLTGPKSKAQVSSKSSQSRKAKVAKRDVGRLAKLLDAPLDVFCEVAKYLHPLDVLHLARATRPLRNLLMSKQSRLVWKTARDIIKLPDCPDGLSEPQYVNLVFCRYCDACGASNVQKAIYDLKIRLCKGCEQLNVLPGARLAGAIGIDLVEDNNLYDLVPCNRREDSYLARFRFYLKADFDAAASIYLSLSSDPRQDTYLAERKKSVQNAYAFSEEIEEWLENEKEGKKMNNERTAANRERDICTRLRDLGYTDDDFIHTYDEFNDDWNKCVYQSRPLTEKIWKNIRPKLEKIITDRRAIKREQMLHDRLLSRRLEFLVYYMRYIKDHAEPDSMDVTFLKPGFADILCTPAAKTLIEQDECQLGITEETWGSFEDALPGLILETRNQMRDKCYEVLVSARTSLGLDSTPEDVGEDGSSGIHEKDALLKLASSVLTIGKNTGMYPAIFKSEIDERSMRSVIATPELHVWSMREITCKPSRIVIANKLLSALGFPLSTSSAYMIAKGNRYECLRCEADCRKKLNWVEMIMHYEDENEWFTKASGHLEERRKRHLDTSIAVIEDHSFDIAEPLVQMLTGQPLDEIKELPPDRDTNCMLCAKLGGDLYQRYSHPQIIAHVRKKHGIAEPTVHEHFEIIYSGLYGDYFDFGWDGFGYNHWHGFDSEDDEMDYLNAEYYDEFDDF